MHFSKRVDNLINFRRNQKIMSDFLEKKEWIETLIDNNLFPIVKCDNCNEKFLMDPWDLLYIYKVNSYEMINNTNNYLIKLCGDCTILDIISLY